MANISVRVSDRLITYLKRFQPVLESARSRDINEPDTSVIVSDILSDMFGYDRYSEVTREHAIRGTFCDLAIKIDNELQFIIEVKAIGLDLKDSHIKQAVDYAANQGVDWVMLTNGINWKVFRITFGKPIDNELVLDLDLLSLSHRNSSHIEALYHLTREGLLKGALPAYHAQQEATNRFFLAAIVLSEPVVTMVRKELRRISPDVRIGSEQIRASLIQDVLKREVVEGEKADEARKKINRAIGKAAKAKTTREPRGQRSEAADTDTSMQLETGEPLNTATEA
ncbi:MAG TPA: type I restriction enzyme HsdR N-terminal domain-containing protein [Blastocatellia bacterium]|nr:type I restriction enzyme HsdR N-terminal domain-containing protein [Blastocatellia bacterium]